MNKIMIIILGIFLLSSVTAIYAGECITIDLSGLDNSEDILYMVVGNTSNTEGLNITFNSETKNVSVCTAINYKPDIFTLIFFNEEQEVVHHYSSGGGGTRTVYVENKTTEYVDNSTIKYVEKAISMTEEDVIPGAIDVPKGDDESNWKHILIPLIIILLTIGLIYFTLNLGKEQVEETEISDDIIEKEVQKDGREKY